MNRLISIIVFNLLLQLLFTGQQLVLELTNNTYSENIQTMSNSIKYECIRIPILKKTEYPTWRAKMLMFLKVIDPAYLDKINDGSYLPTKMMQPTIRDRQTIHKFYTLKERKEWTLEEKTEVLKDSKLRIILYNILDSVMSNKVIACSEYVCFDDNNRF